MNFVVPHDGWEDSAPQKRDPSRSLIAQIVERQRKGKLLSEIAAELNVHPLAIEAAVMGWLDG